MTRPSYIFRIIINLLLFSSITSNVYSDKKIVFAAIKSRNIAPYNTALRGFKDYLKKQKIDAYIMEFTLEGKRKEAMLNICKEIESKGQDMVLTLGTPASKIAQEMIKDFPAVFTMVLDPEESKISFPGVSMNISTEIKLKKIIRIIPHVKRIGLIYSSNSTHEYEEVSQACAQFGFKLIGKKINSGKELPDAFEDISWQIDCFIMIPDSMIYFPKSVEYLLSGGLRKKIPIVGLSSSYTKAGALISFDCDYKVLGEQAAEIAIKILNKKNPVKITYVKPRKIEYSLNLLAAERLGIKFSPEIIKEARKVFGK